MKAQLVHVNTQLMKNEYIDQFKKIPKWETWCNGHLSCHTMRNKIQALQVSGLPSAKYLQATHSK